MRRLAFYFENPFDSPNISLDELLAFATDHLQRMMAQNSGGELSDNITATHQALEALRECHAADLSGLGSRKGSKLRKRRFRKGLPAAVTKLVAGVVARFGGDSPVVKECVPSGRRIFVVCRDDQLEAHLRTLVNAITAHEAELGAPLVAAAENLRAEWAAVHAASEAASGTKTATEAAQRQARQNLQLTLFQNLLKLAGMFPTQPEKLGLYMQQHLLENRSPAPPE